MRKTLRKKNSLELAHGWFINNAMKMNQDKRFILTVDARSKSKKHKSSIKFYGLIITSDLSRNYHKITLLSKGTASSINTGSSEDCITSNSVRTYPLVNPTGFSKKGFSCLMFYFNSLSKDVTEDNSIAIETRIWQVVGVL